MITTNSLIYGHAIAGFSFKPHIRRAFGKWLCVGLRKVGAGTTPRAAYVAWQLNPARTASPHPAERPASD